MCEHQPPFGWCGFFFWGSKGVSMALPTRKYFSLPKAAEILKCNVEDIIHWGAIGAVKIGFPYESDGFDPPQIYDENDLNKHLPDYMDFAFIDRGYLFNAELNGRCTFSSLELTDGRAILFHPSENEFSEWVKYAKNGFEFSQLFMRIEELNELQANENSSIEKPLSNIERETLLVIIAALAKEAKVDIEKTSKAGDLIANMTQIIGAPVGATTIETHLKKINQAIQSRAK
jgi:hypothetical protein